MLEQQRNEIATDKFKVQDIDGEIEKELQLSFLLWGKRCI